MPTLRQIVVKFNLAKPMGMDLGHQTLVVRELQPKGQAMVGGVQVGWKAVRVMGEHVATFDDFVAAIGAKRDKTKGPTKSCDVAFKAEASGVHAHEHAHEFSLALPLGMDLGQLTLIVKGVLPGGQAEGFGIGRGWRVVRVGGAVVATVGQLVEAIGRLKATGHATTTVCFVEPNISDVNLAPANKDAESFRASVFAGPTDDDVADPDDDMMEGYLMKKGTNVVSPWQARWFAARGHYLKYYKNMDAAGSRDNCLCAIDLLLAEVQRQRGVASAGKR